MSRASEISNGDLTGEIYQIVKDQPAIHFRGLKRAANLSSNGQLRHHLDQLESEDALVEVEDGGYTRYFVPGEYDPELRDGLARFARRVPRIIGKLLLQGPMNRTELREALGCADSTLGYHLNRMIEHGDLQRDRDQERSMYSLTDPAFVERVLHGLGETLPEPSAPTPGSSDPPAAEGSRQEPATPSA